MACGIYLIKNKINSKCYIGQSIDIETRWRRHRTDATKIDSPLYRAIRKYKIENFDFSILEECDTEKLNERELFYMCELKTFIPNGYNIDLPDSRPAIIPDYVIETVSLLKSTSLTTDEIGEKVGVSGPTIRAINRGATWRQDSLNYPIRDVLNCDKVNKYCEYCSKLIVGYGKKYCSVSCANQASAQNRTSIDRPTPLKLAEMVVNSSFENVGREYGISGNAIKKWCKVLNIPHLKADLIKWYNQNRNGPIV